MASSRLTELLQWWSSHMSQMITADSEAFHKTGLSTASTIPSRSTRERALSRSVGPCWGGLRASL